jgi:hypothetical protein
MSSTPPLPQDSSAADSASPLDRRDFLHQAGAGFGGLALLDLLSREGYFSGRAGAESTETDRVRDGAGGAPAPRARPGAEADVLAPKRSHFPGKAKAVIFLYMYGGPSQMDLFDYKPELQKRDGKTAKLETRRRTFTEVKLLGSKRKFARRGHSGLWISDALPHLAQHADKLAVLKSLYADSFAHGSANIQANTGRLIQGSPSVGSWLSYGLGTENRNLPSFVVMLDPRGGPISGPANWTAGFMPAAFQGTVLRHGGTPILNLNPPAGITRADQRRQIDTLARLNERHASTRPGYSELQARIASYELAFQLQTTAPDALDLSAEPRALLDAYGINEPRPDHSIAIGPAHFGRQCLIARRLVERGVRFVQIYSGGGHQQQNWDAHYGVEENLRIHCPEIDRPIATLISDLESRGLLDETLIVWGGEFGRQAVVQGEGDGRDHNPKGFTWWMAGGGVKGGVEYGETDELGHEAAVNRRHLRDVHATILHLMGLDHHKLTWFHAGLDHKLTGVVEAEVIREILA